MPTRAIWDERGPVETPMGRLTARLLRAFRAWDTASRAAFVMALALLLAALLLAALGPSDFRSFVLVAAAGLVILTQIIVMWANRGMVMPFTRAQRAYMAGDFDTASQLLEAARAAGKTGVRELTLLGNTYRQVGQLEKSEEVLTEALKLWPNHHFPLYGFGRTLLVQGRYAEAINTISGALELGAPPVVRFDIADASYRLGLREETQLALQEVGQLVDQPHRALMAQYILYRLGLGEQPDADLVQSGLAYWRAEADRFRHTPYGQALAGDVLVMQTLGGGHTDV